MVAALSDPYDTVTQDWLEEQIREPFRYVVARREDIAAFLTKQEEGLRAVDGISMTPAPEAQSAEGAQDISIQAISDSDSAVIKFVTSTLYDALKCGASDIHLETGPPASAPSTASTEYWPR